ncbi:unnamed protein product [Peronospora farinosa]|uniref:Uncharacterized protein n=1 Tax=Peronospora farinosa TaxID=134698 RepID=A0ABN8C0X8_9STRA|nr:unnamed protein product [Peronospora farinosa]
MASDGSILKGVLRVTTRSRCAAYLSARTSKMTYVPLVSLGADKKDLQVLYASCTFAFNLLKRRLSVKPQEGSKASKYAEAVE